MAQLVAVIASTHHPFYYRASTAGAPTGRRSRTSGWPRSSGSGDADRRPPGRPGDGRQRPLPPAVAGQHAAVPRARRPSTTPTGTTRSASSGCRGSAWPATRPSGAHPAGRAGRGVRPGLQQRAAHRPQHHLPDHHPAAAGRPTDRADLHQHLRTAAAPARAVRAAGPDHRRARGVDAGQPAGRGHRHRAPVARARWPAPVRPARTGPGVRRQGGRLDRERRHRGVLRRGDARQLAPAGQRDPRLHGLHADDGRRRRGCKGRLHRPPGPFPHDGGVLHLVPGG